MTTRTGEQPLAPSSGAVRIQGGDGAPARAREHVRTRLDADASTARVADAMLVVSELVTNSVLHAHVEGDQELRLELRTVGDQVRIAVTDPGSEMEPRIRPLDPATPGGWGLRLVDELSSAWGVLHDPAGMTCVWCDLPTDQAPAA